MMESVLILGAKSDIGKALAREYARHGYDLILAARDAGTALRDFASDLRIRSQRNVILRSLDILSVEAHEDFYFSLGKRPAGVISVIGYMGDQTAASKDFREFKRITDTNYTAVACFLNVVANDFQRRRKGFIIGISSVAGDRGRKKNYIYGASKAALSAYLSGLRARLYPYGVHVMTVKPGFVKTRMTMAMKLPPILTATPEDAARQIYTAQRKGQDIIYVKGRWRLIMGIIRLIPERIFKAYCNF